MWPSTTKRATPTSSQDDRRRPFIVVRLVSRQRHVKRAARRTEDTARIGSTNAVDPVTPGASLRDSSPPDESFSGNGIAPGQAGQPLAACAVRAVDLQSVQTFVMYWPR